MLSVGSALSDKNMDEFIKKKALYFPFYRVEIIFVTQIAKITDFKHTLLKIKRFHLKLSPDHTIRHKDIRYLLGHPQVYDASFHKR